MTTGTKIFLAVFAAFVGVLVLYYGVLMPEAQPSASLADVTRDVPQPVTPTVATHESLTMGERDLVVPILTPTDGATAQNTGALSSPPVSIDPSAPVQSQHQLHGSAPSTFHTPPAAVVPNTITSRDASSPSIAANQPVSIGETRNSSSDSYSVKSGDTLSSIAQGWFGDANKWQLIVNANPGVDPARLQVGQKLRMPARDAQPSPVKTQVAADRTYTVRSGDTLIKIARELYNDSTKWKAIYEANRTSIGSDPAELKPGMKLQLPAGAKTS